MEKLLNNLVNAYKSPDPTTQKTAEREVLGLIDTNYVQMMALFADILNKNPNEDVRVGVLVFLAKVFKDKSEEKRAMWVKSTDEKVRRSIRNSLLAGLQQTPQVAKMSNTCVIALAALEMPYDLWKKKQVSALCDLCRQGSAMGLEAVGGICQDVAASYVNPYIKDIAETLYAVLAQAGAPPALRVKALETVSAAMGPLEFVMNEERVRNSLVEQIMGCLGCGVEEVVCEAFKTLGCFAEHGYFYMKAYLDGIYKASQAILALKSADNNRNACICAVLGFWLGLAEKETAVTAEYRGQVQGVQEFAPQRYMQTVSEALVPELIQCMTLLDDDDAADLDLSEFSGDTEYVPSVARECLNAVFYSAYATSSELGDAGFLQGLTTLLFGFAEKLMATGAWKNQAAALWLLEIIAPAVPGAHVPKVAQIAAQTLGTQQAAGLVRALAAESLGVLVEAQSTALIGGAAQIATALAGTLTSVPDSKLIGGECCRALTKIADAYSYENIDNDAAASPLPGCFDAVYKACTAVRDETVQALGYEVINAFISSEVLPPGTPFAQLAVTFLEMVERTSNATTNDAALAARVACLNSCARQSRRELAGLAGRLLAAVSAKFEVPSLPLTQERALETVAVVADILEDKFDSYVPSVGRTVTTLAFRTEEPAVARKAIDVVSCIALVSPPLPAFRSLAMEMFPAIFKVTENIFFDNQTQAVRALAAPYIGLFSDLCTYLGPEAAAAIASILKRLATYAKIPTDPADQDYTDFVYEVRISISRFFLTVVKNFILARLVDANAREYGATIISSLLAMNSGADAPDRLGASALTIITLLAKSTGQNFKTFVVPPVTMGSIVNMVEQIYSDARDSGDTKTLSIAQDALAELKKIIGIQ